MSGALRAHNFNRIERKLDSMEQVGAELLPRFCEADVDDPQGGGGVAFAVQEQAHAGRAGRKGESVVLVTRGTLRRTEAVLNRARIKFRGEKRTLHQSATIPSSGPFALAPAAVSYTRPRSTGRG